MACWVMMPHDTSNVPEEVAMLALVRTPCTMLELCAHTPLVRLAAGLWLNALALPPQWDLGQEIHRGDGTSTTAKAIMAGLYRSALAQIGLQARSDQCQWAHYASCAVALAWISASWRYILSTPSTVSGGEVLRACPQWPPSGPPRG
jgi:hypothetical protein